ncbi:hypothetical protein N7513_008330 [Penicillium frequentans]|uniref:Inhibitor I9 domain-containing protein n=1 Tax=Penicillium frequentans TaxID=3151616 RepID=A0AAD6GG56_9EURO|nr:hypothetical protein N7513_008330 [Penicillium glabrum]KAJ5541458.1 hypothetical protein N7494_006534 [Penicillium glabrum]
MSSFVVTFKPDAPDSEVQKVKDEITSGGGQIDHEYSLIKGFSFTRPEVATLDVKSLSSSPHVDNIEADKVVTTQ